MFELYNLLQTLLSLYSFVIIAYSAFSMVLILSIGTNASFI